MPGARQSGSKAVTWKPPRTGGSATPVDRAGSLLESKTNGRERGVTESSCRQTNERLLESRYRHTVANELLMCFKSATMKDQKRTDTSK